MSPLAERLGLEVITVDAQATDELASRILADHRGEVVVVAGHSNTVPAIIEALGAPPVAPIADGSYGDLFIVTIDDRGDAVVVRLRF